MVLSSSYIKDLRWSLKRHMNKIISSPPLTLLYLRCIAHSLPLGNGRLPCVEETTQQNNAFSRMKRRTWSDLHLLRGNGKKQTGIPLSLLCSCHPKPYLYQISTRGDIRAAFILLVNEAQHSSENKDKEGCICRNGALRVF